VVEEAGSAETHEVHVSGSVDCCIALKDPDIVAFADTFEGSSQTCKTSTDDEHVDARVGVRAQRLSFHLGRHVDDSSEN